VAEDASGSKLVGLTTGPIWTNVVGRIAQSFNGEWAILNTPARLEDLTLLFSFTFWVNPAAKRRQYANIFGTRSVMYGD